MSHTIALGNMLLYYHCCTRYSVASMPTMYSFTAETSPQQILQLLDQRIKFSSSQPTTKFTIQYLLWYSTLIRGQYADQEPLRQAVHVKSPPPWLVAWHRFCGDRSEWCTGRDAGPILCTDSPVEGQQRGQAIGGSDQSWSPLVECNTNVILILLLFLSLFFFYWR